MVFDREGYSPKLFKDLWEEDRIACQTYRKGSYEPWPEDQFQPFEVVLRNGQTVTWQLAERGVLLGSKKKEKIWLREIRKLTDRGHQTAVLSTAFKSEMPEIARSQFGRWTQENFFRYASQSFDLDRLVDYQLGEIPETTEVVNPRWRELDGQVRKRLGKLTRKKAEFADLALRGKIEPENVEEFMEKKTALQSEIEADEKEISELKTQRRDLSRKVKLSELPAADQFKSLNQRGKHFVDMIKIVAYRAETVISQVLAEKMSLHHRDEVRGLACQVFQSDVNLRPDPEAGTLTVELHGMSTPRDNEAVEHLCQQLNETQTEYPGTNLRLIYKTVLSNLP
jgi:hypothetical protein